eukprot:scaffold40457_cov23-Tisochrysis_lutea.AAC.1
MLLTPIMYPIPAEECRLLLLGTGRKLFPSSLRLLLLAELTREVVEMLLKAGADTSTVDSLGYTALFEAVRKGNDGCISLMLKYNAKWVLLWYEGIKCEVGCVKNLLGLVAVGKVELAGELQSGVDHSWVEISPLHNCVHTRLKCIHRITRTLAHILYLSALVNPAHLRKHTSFPLPDPLHGKR